MKTIKNLKAEEIRKSILQLAIQGKLVKQDPNDEPASELVKRIYAEKQKLIKEGKIKKDKTESYIFKGDDNCYYEKIGNNEPVKLDDLPFDIPDNWMWIRFPNLVNFVLGKTPERHNVKYWFEGIYPWFSIADMKDKQVVSSTKEKVSEAAFKDNFSSNISPAGTLIMSFKLTVGRVSILGVDALHNEAIISIFPYLNDSNAIIKNWLFSMLGLIVAFVDKTDAIKGSTLNKEKMCKMLIPLPPINEQKRIIDRLSETEPLISKYDSLEKKLTTLESEFPEKLKKSILQYAIEGKLVKQDPNDESASVLIERIKAEKEKLIKEGKIKRDKNESYIYQGDDKNYYENLPSGWVLTTYNTVLNNIFGGGTPNKSNPCFWNGDISWCSVKDLGENLFINKTIDSITKDGLENSSAHIVEKGDLILCTRMAVGKLRIAGRAMAINQDLKGLVTSENINRFFFIIQVNATNFVGTGTTVKGLKIQDFLSHGFLLPPLKEQNRIVIKTDNLFALLSD